MLGGTKMVPYSPHRSVIVASTARIRQSRSTSQQQFQFVLRVQCTQGYVVQRERVLAGAGIDHSVQQRDVGFYGHTSGDSSPAHNSGCSISGSSSVVQVDSQEVSNLLHCKILLFLPNYRWRYKCHLHFYTRYTKKLRGQYNYIHL